MSTQLTNTGRVLLGMVAEGHRTGYAIKAEIERSTRFYWSASIGGIYPELKRLERDRLLTRSDDFRGEAERHDYRLTKAGRMALHDWLTEREESAIEMRNEGLLKLRFAAVLDRDERVAIVERMRARHEIRVGELEARLDEDDFDDPCHRLTAEYGLGWNRWARDWCDATLSGVAAMS
jgi:DNA-binding PadR family transcriptional regulator